MSGTSKTKICGKCDLEKPISEFYKSSKRVKNPWCKLCMKEVSKAKRAAMTKAERSEIYHRRGKAADHKPKTGKGNGGKPNSVNTPGGGLDRVKTVVVFEDTYRLKKYGLTAADYPDKCEVCKDSSTQICIDHDHVTGLFRGFLCTRCNTALGFTKNNPKILRKLANYLRKHERETEET